MADGTITMEGVEIIFKNFEGKPGPYTPEGVRTFGVKLPDALAEQLLADGWNVKHLKPREDDEDQDYQQPFLPCAIRFDVFPPNAYMITSRGRKRLDENNIALLDWADITNVDLIVRPFNYEVRGDKGVKAYVKTLFVTIEEDALESKYADLDTQ